MELNKHMAELVGIILGDGHIHKKTNMITIVGSLEDLDYYKDQVIPLFEKLFDKKPTLSKRKDCNTYYLTIHSKEIFDFLTSKIGMKRGPKDTFLFQKKLFLMTIYYPIF